MTVEQAADVLGISRNSAYTQVKEGSIPSLRLGRRLVIPRAGLERMLDAMPAHPAGGKG